VGAGVRSPPPSSSFFTPGWASPLTSGEGREGRSLLSIFFQLRKSRMCLASRPQRSFLIGLSLIPLALSINRGDPLLRKLRANSFSPSSLSRFYCSRHARRSSRIHARPLGKGEERERGLCVMFLRSYRAWQPQIYLLWRNFERAMRKIAILWMEPRLKIARDLRFFCVPISTNDFRFAQGGGRHSSRARRVIRLPPPLPLSLACPEGPQKGGEGREGTNFDVHIFR